MSRWTTGAVFAFAGIALVACLGRGDRVDSDAKGLLNHNKEALQQLRFGMSMEKAQSIMGRKQVTPPWANAWKIGPDTVDNPFDTIELESPIGETYAVHRYAIRLYGNGNCPFVRGEADLAPLIFVDSKLVGWRWSYLEDALARRLSAAEKELRFGGFCGDASERSRE